jgi:hypothetical protein
VKEQDVDAILDWEKNQAVPEGVEVAFKPARVILQVIVQLMVLKYTSHYYMLRFLAPVSLILISITVIYSKYVWHIPG